MAGNARQAATIVAAAVLVALVAKVPSASAQPAIAPYEIFAGYSYLPADGNDFPRDNSSGFQIGGAVTLNRWSGLVGDMGAHFSHTSTLGFNFPGVTANTAVYEFLVGPRFIARGRLSPFVQALAGETIVRTSLSGFSEGGFTLAVGGGVDAAITDRIAARVEFDQLGSFADVVENNARIGLGLVVKLGKP